MVEEIRHALLGIFSENGTMLVGEKHDRRLRGRFRDYLNANSIPYTLLRGEGFYLPTVKASVILFVDTANRMKFSIEEGTEGAERASNPQTRKPSEGRPKNPRGQKGTVTSGVGGVFIDPNGNGPFLNELVSQFNTWFPDIPEASEIQQQQDKYLHWSVQAIREKFVGESIDAVIHSLVDRFALLTSTTNFTSYVISDSPEYIFGLGPCEKQ